MTGRYLFRIVSGFQCTEAATSICVRGQVVTISARIPVLADIPRMTHEYAGLLKNPLRRALRCFENKGSPLLSSSFQTAGDGVSDCCLARDN